MEGLLICGLLGGGIVIILGFLQVMRWIRNADRRPPADVGNRIRTRERGDDFARATYHAGLPELDEQKFPVTVVLYPSSLVLRMDNDKALLDIPWSHIRGAWAEQHSADGTLDEAISSVGSALRSPFYYWGTWVSFHDPTRLRDLKVYLETGFSANDQGKKTAERIANKVMVYRDRAAQNSGTATKVERRGRGY